MCLSLWQVAALNIGDVTRTYSKPSKPEETRLGYCIIKHCGEWLLFPQYLDMGMAWARRGGGGENSAANFATEVFASVHPIQISDTAYFMSGPSGASNIESTVHAHEWRRYGTECRSVCST